MKRFEASERTQVDALIAIRDGTRILDLMRSIDLDKNEIVRMWATLEEHRDLTKLGHGWLYVIVMVVCRSWISTTQASKVFFPPVFASLSDLKYLFFNRNPKLTGVIFLKSNYPTM